MVRPPIRPALGVLVSLALALAACGGDDGAADDGRGDGSTSTTTSAATAPASAGSPADDAVPLPSAGCRTGGADPAVEERRSLAVAGTERSYLVTIPESATGRDPVPLVVDFHGLAEGAESQADVSSWSTLAEQEGAVVAFPQATGEPPAWNTNIANNNLDVVFVDALIDQLGRDACIDTGRTYATGFSTGAEFATTVGCMRPLRFAAVAAVAGVDRKNRCTPSRPVPVVAVHGTADPVRFFNGGIGDMGRVLSGGDAPPVVSIPPADLDGEGVPAEMRQWADANGCAPGPPTSTDVSASVILRSFECPAGSDVAIYVIEGGGHTWPGSEASAALASRLGATSSELDATAAFWDFLTRRALPQGR